MTLDRKDIAIGVLVLIVGFQFFIGSLLGGALMRLEQASISVYDANRILALVERVHATNELCVRVRVNADQSVLKYLFPNILEDGHVDGEVRHQTAGAGSGLRGIRVAAGGAVDKK